VTAPSTDLDAKVVFLLAQADLGDVSTFLAAACSKRAAEQHRRRQEARAGQSKAELEDTGKSVRQGRSNHARAMSIHVPQTLFSRLVRAYELLSSCLSGELSDEAVSAVQRQQRRLRHDGASRRGGAEGNGRRAERVFEGE
jgi:hypothetical protein